MKKTLLILIVAFTSLTAKAQNVIYLFGMNPLGQPVINTIPMTTFEHKELKGITIKNMAY